MYYMHNVAPTLDRSAFLCDFFVTLHLSNLYYVNLCPDKVGSVSLCQSYTLERGLNLSRDRRPQFELTIERLLKKLFCHVAIPIRQVDHAKMI